MMRCEELFGAERGREIQELVEASIGEPCPCITGRACPLRDVVIPVQVGSDR